MTWLEMTIRQRHEAVLAAVEEGVGPTALSERLGIAQSTAQRWLSLARAGRSLPGPSRREGRRDPGQVPDAPALARDWPSTSPTAVLFLDAERRHCLYPLWDDAHGPTPAVSALLVCGDLRMPGSSYCRPCRARTLKSRSEMSGRPFVLSPISGRLSGP